MGNLPNFYDESINLIKGKHTRTMSDTLTNDFMSLISPGKW